MDTTGILIGVVLMFLGGLQLFLTYRYYKNVQKIKNHALTAPFAIWSSVVFGIGVIFISLMVFAGRASDISRGFSIFSAILFWVAAAIALIKANQMRKKIKPVNGKTMGSSWQVITVYIIVVAAVISGLISIL
ncbi:hypothetical protein GCM10019995_16350 [Lactobacillus kefiranofaciens subsp. kefirgranum]|uniref:hypothetical protein n=1 Tax=Lactobacillus kefiranofaciens TaxID=267818 RepID=UPI0006CF4EC5|nr:hypothetical protein [Lactobacillus kefiranofaciens]KRL28299.1 hypothetical protein FC94_GL000590 [Lactobacillus kefiranofaciens subsp. kefirgranum DSM 10550 = JCM 8572]PAK98001.1 hypothetical protein B8W86_07030 [Lactobacillus kefiranofaciens]